MYDYPGTRVLSNHSTAMYQRYHVMYVYMYPSYLLQLTVHISTCIMNCIDPNIDTTTIDNHVVPFVWHKQHIALFLHTDCNVVVQSWHNWFNKSPPSNSSVVCPPSWKRPCWVYRQRVNGRRKQIPLLFAQYQSIPCTVLVVMESQPRMKTTHQ